MTNNYNKEELPLTEAQAKEILKRDKDLADETTFPKNWETVKGELLEDYRQ